MSDLVSQVSSTLSGLKQEFSSVAHNLANVETVGYKRICNKFSKVLAAQGGGSVAQAGDGVNVESIVDFTQGNLSKTDRSLDFALDGKGFFEVETLEGSLYTRNGMFRILDGRIVDTAGRTVAGESGPIMVPPNVVASQISVSNDGSIGARIGAGDIPIGKFKLVDFGENEKELQHAGINAFQAPADLKPDAATKLTVKQGYAESSNVQMVEELVDMMMVSRLYEANMQFVSIRRDASKSIVDLAMS